jgi:hypothetical protein
LTVYGVFSLDRKNEGCSKPATIAYLSGKQRNKAIEETRQRLVAAVHVLAGAQAGTEKMEVEHG